MSDSSRSVGAHNSNFTMVYGRYIYTIPMVYKATNITGGAPPCRIMEINGLFDGTSLYVM